MEVRQIRDEILVHGQPSKSNSVSFFPLFYNKVQRINPREPKGV